MRYSGGATPRPHGIGIGLIVSLGVGIAVFAVTAPFASSRALQSDTCRASWRTVPSPRGGDELRGLAALGDNDVWAVGEAAAYSGHALIEHWNGARWRIVESAPIAKSGFEALVGLEDVAATSSSDAWAVGGEQVDGGSQTLIEHWDGKTWTRVDSPNPARGRNDLYAVAAASPSAAWAVGDSNNNVPLILGWDGRRWQTIYLVSWGLADVEGSAQAVAAISPTNVWVGGRLQQGGVEDVVLHWDGTGWKTVRIPVEGISDVSVVSENDIWAVGGGAFSPGVLHWDGSRWRRVRGGVPLSGDLDAITALSARNVWVAGTTNRQTNAHIFAEHWDGHHWKFFRTPRVRGTNLSFLNDLAASANAVWTVSLAFFRRDAPLIERYACAR